MGCANSKQSSTPSGGSPNANVPNPKVKFETSMGTFEAELYLSELPLTVSNIVDLARSGFYDGGACETTARVPRGREIRLCVNTHLLSLMGLFCI